VRHAQGHHIHHWANGGPTRLSNLLSVCRRHHRALHEEGYTVVRDADGALHFSTPRGRPIPEVPAAPAEANRGLGLAIDARTGLPSWCGERLDLGWAIGVLHPACNPGAYGSASGDEDGPEARSSQGGALIDSLRSTRG
jgi:hypothetical protein